MYKWNYFYGAIMLNEFYYSNPPRNLDDVFSFIQEKMIDKNYQYFHPKIFSVGSMEKPFFYDNILISFSRTGKWFFDETSELNDFIMEFEDILTNLDFNTAQVKISSPLFDYTLFWCNRQRLDSFDLEHTLKYFHDYKTRFYESSKFYFGFGEINLNTGWCVNKYDEKLLENFDFQFPDFEYKTN